VDKANDGTIKRPGEMREHVFDFEEHIRCVVSLDYVDADRPVLHISCSSDWDTELTLGDFLVKAHNMHTVLFPDTLLPLKHSTTTGKAIHLFYDVPDSFLVPTQ